jgi:signal recognition particle GTPase
MFESLQKKLSGVFKNLSGKGKLTEKNIKDAVREVKLALLEADVHYKVVKEFVEKGVIIAVPTPLNIKNHSLFNLNYLSFHMIM